MKSKTALAISILLNAGLIFAFFFKPEPQLASSQGASETKIVTNVVVNRSTERVEVAKPQLIRLDWRQLEAEDYKTYIKNLREIGCPEETIRDIVIADLNKLYATKWKNIVRGPGKAKYWEPLDSSMASNPKSLAARQSLDVERRNLIRDLLGVEGDDEVRKQEMSFSSLDNEDGLLDYMPEDQRKTAVGIKTWDRTEVHRIQELAASEHRQLTADENTEINRIKSEANSRMRAALGDDGYLQWSMRTSSTATQLRNRLVGFGPTEEEYVAIYAEQIGLKDGLGDLKRAGDAANTPEQQQLLQSQFEQSLQQKIGQQRYQEYLLTQDPMYAQVMHQAQEGQVPRDQALNYVQTYVQALREFNQGNQAIMRDPQLGAEQRAEALRSLRAKFQSDTGNMQQRLRARP